MSLKMLNNKRINTGFTVIELLVVVFIGVALSTIILTSISTSRQKARDGVRVADIRRIQLALEHYYDACGQYPNVISNLSFATGCSGSTNFGSFMGQLVSDPTNSGPYIYRYYAEAPATSPTKCLAYHIGARLEGTNTALSEDVDLDDSANVSSLATCTGTGAAFDGIDDTIGGGGGVDIMFDGTSNF
jgi:type II secretory pathway pseudopilin PulG